MQKRTPQTFSTTLYSQETVMPTVTLTDPPSRVSNKKVSVEKKKS